MHSRDLVASEHKKHDRLLVARYAGGDAYPSEQPDAEQLVARCSECAALAADIRLLAIRTAELPSPRRPRDFRISAEQAEQLHGNWFERAMRRLAAPGLGALRPVAGAAFAIGLTMTVIGSLPLAGGAAAPAGGSTADQPVIRMEATAAPVNQPLGSDTGVEMPPGAYAPGAPTEEHTDGKEAEVNARSSPLPETDDFDGAYLPDGRGGDSNVGADEAAGPTANPLVHVGLLIAAVALAVLLLAIVARRRFADPLLR